MMVFTFSSCAVGDTAFASLCSDMLPRFVLSVAARQTALYTSTRQRSTFRGQMIHAFERLCNSTWQLIGMESLGQIAPFSIKIIFYTISVFELGEKAVG